MKQRKSLGENMVEEGLITPEQFEDTRAEEKKSGQNFRRAVVKKGYITEEDLVAFVSGKLAVPRIELRNYLVDAKLIDLVPEDLARKHGVIPVLRIGGRLVCAMADPANVFALDELRTKTNLTIEPAIATESEIKNALDEYYGARGGIQEIIKSAEAGAGERAKDDVEEPAVKRIVNLTITNAALQGASDVHLEPEEGSLRVRFRVDGLLHDETAIPRHLQSAVISRVKILSNLDIAERRTPQDGRFTVNAAGKEIDIRVSCVPTIWGENVVLRLLDVSGAKFKLKDIGFSKETLEKYQRLIGRPNGIILVTGPTGSGKTTTLYASLGQINTVEKNIITIEDPVEYRLAGVRQIQVNPKANLTFASGLRSILRQDPNIIMVGEIRDLEAAEIAIHAAQTGHLVFSTLHTNDAAGAVTRLIDMGVEPFLLASSIIGVMAQRLVRTICGDCKEKVPTAGVAEELRRLGVPGADLTLWKGRGCPKCLNTGCRGRVAIFELLIPDDGLRRLILSKASNAELKRHAVAAGMVALQQDGLARVREGKTTLEEILRVCRED